MKQHWIFLRGWGRDSRHWGKFVDLFMQQFPEQAVHLYDLPGTGHLNSQTSPTSIAEIVDSLNDRWQKEFPGQAAHILALSFGGMAAIDWSKRYPDVVSSLVLMNISANGACPFYKRLHFSVYPELFTIPFMKVCKREAMIIHLTSNLYSARAELADEWCEFARKHPVSNLNLLRQLWAATQFRLPEIKPDKKILILNSLEDKLVQTDCSNNIATKWQLPIKKHPTAGHDLTLDAPNWVIEQIKHWID
jgi:pimeloyl-ACP methyl ester carboxylesterase